MVKFEQGLGKRSEEVLRALLLELDSGLLPVGSQFGTEQELCVRFDASRNTIRRAIARLVADGRLEVRSRQGIFVRQAVRILAPASRTLSVMFPFNTRSLIDIQRYVLDKGYLLSVFSHYQPGDWWRPDRERLFLERVHAERHRGLLAFCTPTPPHNDDLLRQMEADGIRVLHIEHYAMDLPPLPFLLPDYRRAGYLAATKLLIAGYRHLVFFALDSDWPAVQLLRQGFAEALNDHGEGFDPARNSYDFPLNVMNPEVRAKHCAYLHSLPPATGIVARSLIMSRISLQLLREMGKKVPEDYGAVSYSWLIDEKVPEDNGAASNSWLIDEEATAGLDTIEFDRAGLVRRAVDLLTDDADLRVHELAAPVWVSRGSTVVAPHG